MSQPLAFASPEELVTRLTYEGARKAILDRRGSLSVISDAVAARTWVMDLGDAVVRSPFFFFLPCFLTLARLNYSDLLWLPA
jgi:hypothetical protein